MTNINLEMLNAIVGYMATHPEEFDDDAVEEEIDRAAAYRYVPEPLIRRLYDAMVAIRDFPT